MINFQMIPVQGGTFMMGSNDGYKDEKPIHPVTLSSFYIGQFTVTQKEWEAIMDSNTSDNKGDDLPVTNVSWNDVQEFIQKLNIQTGKQYRLPTEAEWEFAARGGNQSKGFEYAGSNNVDEVAWHRNNCRTGPYLVGLKTPNELGLHDMSGNVGEWCQDWYGSYFADVQTNPKGPDTGDCRVIRGGSWSDDPPYCYSTLRNYSPASFRSYNLGFRLVHDFETFNQSSKPNLIFVEGGTFTMGDESGQEYEKSVHPVTLSSFYIGQFAVTQKEWEAVMGSNPSDNKGDDLPVTNVTWKEVQKFLTELNAQTGKQYRLPTEAEWEYAARGGNQSKGFQYAGSHDVEEVAWYYISSNDELHPVGQKKANELGIYDMSGNVWEWCHDWYGEYPTSAQTNPKGPDSGSRRVIRGGSWDADPRYCRVTVRGNVAPGDRILYSLGFRLAHDFETFKQLEKSNSNMEQTIETNHDFQKSQGYIKAAIFNLFHDSILELTSICEEYVRAIAFSTDGLISGSTKGWEDSDIVNMSDTIGYFKDDAYKLGHMIQRVEKLIDCVDKSSDLANLFVHIDECKYVLAIDFPGAEHDKIPQELIDTIVEAYQSSK